MFWCFTQASIYRDENNVLDLYINLLRFTRFVCLVVFLCSEVCSLKRCKVCADRSCNPFIIQK